MPKSKRDKKISLTKTDKKGKALKEHIINDVKSCVEKYNSVYVFTYRNMRTDKMQDIRQEWKPSKFVFGKNKVIGVGLGRTPEEEIGDDLHKISKCLRGPCGLLFTDSEKEEVIDWFNTYEIDDFARSGFKANKTIILEEGPLKQFSHSMEPYLRQLGMPTKLDRGVVTLIKSYQVCKEGDILTPEQAKILQLLDYRLAKFKLILKARWTKNDGFERLVDENNEEESTETQEMEED